MLKKLFSFLLILTMIATCLVSAVAEGKQTITELSSPLGTASQERMDKRISTFVEKHPDTIIDITYVTDPLTTIRQQLTAGVGTDCILTDVSSIALYVQAGYLMNLDDYVEKYGWDERFTPWAYNNCFVDGHLYGLPGEAQGMFMFYNKALFDKHGWSVPKTADEFYKLCEDITAAGILPIAFGTAGYSQCNEHWISVVFNSYLGTEKMEELLSGKTPWTIPEVGEATQILVDMYSKGWLCNDFPVISDSDSTTLFVTERAAIKMSGTWFTSSLVDFPDFEWDYFILPSLAGNDKPVLPISTNGAYALNASSKVDPDTLVDWLDWYYNKEQCEEAMVKNYTLYPLTDLAPDASKLDSRMIRISEDLKKVGTDYDIGYNPWTFWPTAVETAAWSNIESVVYGDMSIEEYQNLLQVGMEEDIKNNRQKSF